LLNAKWTIVESGVKHHQTNKPNGLLLKVALNTIKQTNQMDILQLVMA
jgi:hypothetical protein